MPDHTPEIMPETIPPGPSSRTLKRVGLGAAAVALLIVVVGTAERISATSRLRDIAADASIPTVSVVSPKPGGAGGALSLPGNVQAFSSASIYARTTGYVRERLADIGDHVRAGQVLAVLDAPEVDQQLAQAQADYQTALANQRLSGTTARRWASMLKQDAVSQQEADEKAGDLAAKSALANASLANVRRLRALQGFTRITAPFAGVVTSRSAQTGALVVSGNAAAQPLFTVSSTQRMRIYVRVPQSYSAQLHPGLTAALTLPEYPGKTFPATLTRSSGAVDTQSGAVLVMLESANLDGALKPGAFAQVAFTLAPDAGSSLSLPGSAILYGSAGPSVALVDQQGMVTVRPITIVRDEGARVVVSGGIRPSDRVIDNPPDSTHTGLRVSVQAAESKSAAHAR
ncbi:MAG: efflux RND transporter periplasmic adaptor subunit [Novosphingobium sp.]